MLFECRCIFKCFFIFAKNKLLEKKPWKYFSQVSSLKLLPKTKGKDVNNNNFNNRVPCTLKIKATFLFQKGGEGIVANPKEQQKQLFAQKF